MNVMNPKSVHLADHVGKNQIERKKIDRRGGRGGRGIEGNDLHRIGPQVVVFIS
jgi:hypothetical protein